MYQIAATLLKINITSIKDLLTETNEKLFFFLYFSVTTH